ncbi:MAG: hypothetical protein HY509_02220, partial [Acidobacteria bacterium]|nr:hypothetical protein [Acidobacteriota bacterium]
GPRGPWVHLALTLLALVLNAFALWRGIVGIGRDLQIDAEIAEAGTAGRAEAAEG